MGRPREHDEATRARLLAEAARLLADEGPNAVTVRGVAERAGTTTRAVYALFGAREGVLRALYHDAADLMTRYHEDVPDLEDPVEEFLLLAEAYRRAAVEHPHAYALLLGQVPGFTADRDDVLIFVRSFDRVTRTLTRMADAGGLGGRAPVDVARQMWALVHGLTSLELQGLLGPSSEADHFWHDAVRTAVTGYSKQPAAEVTTARD